VGVPGAAGVVGRGAVDEGYAALSAPELAARAELRAGVLVCAGGALVQAPSPRLTAAATNPTRRR